MQKGEDLEWKKMKEFWQWQHTLPELVKKGNDGLKILRDMEKKLDKVLKNQLGEGEGDAKLRRIIKEKLQKQGVLITHILQRIEPFLNKESSKVTPDMAVMFRGVKPIVDSAEELCKKIQDGTLVSELRAQEKERAEEKKQAKTLPPQFKQFQESDDEEWNPASLSAADNKGKLEMRFEEHQLEENWDDDLSGDLSASNDSLDDVTMESDLEKEEKPKNPTSSGKKK